MKIKSIKIENFRNVENDSFECKRVNIWKGKNELGKSNRLNAIVFLLLGKVLTDKYGIGENDIDSVLCNKTDERGRRPVCKVSATFENGQTITRVYKESWVKKRGSLDAVYEGNLTELYNNESVVTQNEWNELLKQVFEIKECAYKNKDLNIIQAYMDPLYLFQKVDYKVLRALLESLVGCITPEDIFKCEPATLIAKQELEKYSYDAAKARTGVNKTIIDRENGLDTRITQIEAQLEVLKESSFDEVKYKELSNANFNLQVELKNLTEHPSDKVVEIKQRIEVVEKESQDKFDKVVRDIASKKNDIDNAFNTASMELNSKLMASKEKDLTTRKNVELLNLQSDLQIKRQELYAKSNEVLTAKNKYDSLKNQFDSLNAEISLLDNSIKMNKEGLASKLNEKAPVSNCPHCGGVLNQEYIDEFENKRLKAVEMYKANISSLEEQKSQKQAKINEICALASKASSEYKDVMAKKSVLEALVKQTEEKYNAVKVLPFEQYSDDTKALEKELEELSEKHTDDVQSLANVRNELLAKVEVEKNSKLSNLKNELQIAMVDAETLIIARKNEISKQISDNNLEIESLLQAKAQNELRAQKLEELKKVQSERNEKQALYEAIVLYIQTEIKLVNAKCYDATGIKFVMLEDQFNGGLKEVCYPVYSDGFIELPFINCSTSRKLILGCKMIDALKNLIGTNDLPVLADRCEALDNEHLNMLGTNQMFITQVSNDEKIILTQED